MLEEGERERPKKALAAPLKARLMSLCILNSLKCSGLEFNLQVYTPEELMLTYTAFGVGVDSP